MSQNISLADALAMHKQASAQEQRKKVILKAAADLIIARDGGDEEMLKVAAANMTAVVTQIAMEKDAGLRDLATRGGKYLVEKGRKHLSKGLTGAGYKLQRAAVPGGIKDMARGAASSVASGAKKVGRKALTSGKKALGRTGRKVVRKGAPYAAGAAAGGLAGAALSGGKKSKQEKKAGILTYLAPQYAKARAMQQASGAKPGLAGKIGTWLAPEISQAKSMERLAGQRAGTDIRGNKRIDTPDLMRLMPRKAQAAGGAQ